MTVTVNKLKAKTAQTQPQAADFEDLFQAHWTRVYEVLYRLVGDPAEAEDLALTAFFKLHQQPLKKVANPIGWLYRVATNLGLNALRSRQRREQYELQGGKILLHAAPTQNPAALHEQAETRACVRQILAKMKKRSAKILVLRYSGLSYAEVAAAVNASPKSIGTIIRRAENDFERRYLAHCEADERTR